MDTAGQKRHRWCDVSVWFMLKGGRNLCVRFSEHTHTNTWVRPKLITRYLTTVWCIMWCRYLCCCWLQDATVCVCVCVSHWLYLLSSQFLLVLSPVLSCCFQEAAFRMANGFPGRTPPPQFLLGDNGRSAAGAWSSCVCIVMRGIYWGSSGLPFRKLQIYPSSREALVCGCVRVCTVFLCLLGLNLLTRIKTWKKSSPSCYVRLSLGLALGFRY